MDVWMMRVRVLSIDHLTVDTANEPITSNFEWVGGTYAVGMPQGMMLYVPIAVGGDQDLPDDLQAVVEWAHAAGHEWIRFDPDGDVEPSLPLYDWS